MKFCSLASGSSGNCLVASAGHTTVLIDAGLSGIRVQRALADADIDPAKLSAILVTHEHRDHIHGVGVLARRFKLPVYANAGTWRAMAPDLGKLADHQKRVFVTGQAFDIGDMEIDSFATSHDAAEPVGFTLTDGQSAMGIATDTGTPTSAMSGPFGQGARGAGVQSRCGHAPDGALSLSPQAAHRRGSGTFVQQNRGQRRGGPGGPWHDAADFGPFEP